MEHLRSVLENLPGNMNIDGRNLVDELNELGKLRTAIMMEKCSRKDEVVVCPIPRKQTTFRSFGDSNESGAVSDLSNILASKASPPYYSGSPPIRSGNPLIHDAHFREQRPAQLPALGASRSTRSILSMA